MKVTLAMVAEESGVSPSTVSRILNGTARVNPEKEAKVRATIARLGFRPDHAARTLAGGRTSTIGVVTQFIDSPFYGEVLRGIEDELRRAQHVPLFVSGHWSEAEEMACIDLLRDRRVDGVIALNSCLADETLSEIAQSLPLVVTGRRLVGAHLSSLDYDNVAGARAAVEHLVALGHERIAFISGPMNHADARERLGGYMAALGTRAHRDPRLIVDADYQEQGGYEAMRRLMDEGVPFTAVVAANDQMAFGASLAMHERGVRVPDDVSLVGFDDLFVSRYLVPPLTTVHHSAQDLGVMASRALLGLIGGETQAHQTLATELRVRASTAAPARQVEGMRDPA
jgi:LacI family transcriptional regulator